MDGGGPDAEGLGRFPDQPAGRGAGIGVAEDGFPDEGVQLREEGFLIFDDDAGVLDFQDPRNGVIRRSREFAAMGGSPFLVCNRSDRCPVYQKSPVASIRFP